MRKFITAIPATAVTQDFTAAINASLVPLNDFKIHLTDDEKIGMRSMAEGREGFARLISRIADQFPDALARADSPQELSTLLDYYDSLEANRMALLQAMETIEETQLGAATDIMTLVDRYSANLRISRAHESSLNLAMREVDDWNARYVNKTTPPPAPSAEI